MNTTADLFAAQVSEAQSPQTCRRCELWKHATQAVEGEGDRRAKILLVGEQPGDEEDLSGHPFVGPAGRTLDEALDSASIGRQDVFITNAVKHFKWEPRGKRRLHKKPTAAEIDACNVWLDRELTAVKPRVVIALGGTALRALTDRALPIESARRQDLWYGTSVRIVATYHPSAILRARDEQIETLRGHLIQDLKYAKQLAAEMI
jgi:uracil-DNA glycosylase family protein